MRFANELFLELHTFAGENNFEGKKTLLFSCHPFVFK